jgi:prepilin-type N-terminal cleavage/methylation domain-containing protein
MKKPYFAKATKGAQGFTLLETMVAVTILALAVAGPIYVADRSLVATQVAKENLTASFLAQEGIEYVRSMRDHEFLYAYGVGGPTVSENAWNAFVNNSGGSGGGSIASCISAPCALDPFASLGMGFGASYTLVRCFNNGSCPLYLSPTGQYTLVTAGNTRTPYTRRITASIVSTTDVLVTSKVSWSNHGAPYTVTVTTHLTPWQ